MSQSICAHDDGDESKSNWPVVGLLTENQHFILLGKYQKNKVFGINQHYDRLWILASECDGDVFFEDDDIRRLTEVTF